MLVDQSPQNSNCAGFTETILLTTAHTHTPARLFYNWSLAKSYSASCIRRAGLYDPVLVKNTPFVSARLGPFLLVGHDVHKLVCCVRPCISLSECESLVCRAVRCEVLETCCTTLACNLCSNNSVASSFLFNCDKQQRFNLFFSWVDARSLIEGGFKDEKPSCDVLFVLCSWMHAREFCKKTIHFTFMSADAFE